MIETAAAVFMVHRTANQTVQDEKDLPEFTGNVGTKDPEKINAQIADKTARFLDTSHNIPYYGRFTSYVYCVVFDPVFARKPVSGAWTVDDAIDAKDISLAKELTIDVMQHIGPLFSPDGGFNRGPVRLVGPDIRQFAKMWGIQSAILDTPLPHSLWYGSDYRDIIEAAAPTQECKTVPMRRVWSLWAKHDKRMARLPDNIFDGASVDDDLAATMILAQSLGMFPLMHEQLDEAIAALLVHEETAEPTPKKRKKVKKAAEA